MASVPREDLRAAHYLSYGKLFDWARSCLGMPLEEETLLCATCSGHLEALQRARQQLHQHHRDWEWLGEAGFIAAKHGHIHVLHWLRGLDSGYDWGVDVRVTLGAA
ncbi:hypothetical protein B484DRAFT_408399 [Ochromonadaceae sp. CCMP2298]|nr:hypothetical protein B484DRAFT_408399 [Ochromonadaceae sp. CCMP2298]